MDLRKLLIEYSLEQTVKKTKFAAEWNTYLRLPHAQFVMEWQNSTTETTSHSINEETETKMKVTKNAFYPQQVQGRDQGTQQEDTQA
jgi:hypothetical protein